MTEHPPGSRLRRWIKALALTLAGLTALLVAAVAIAPLVLPDTVLAGWLERAVNAQIPGTLHIQAVRWRPPLGVSVHEVTLSAPGEREAALRVGHLTLQFDPTGLRHRHIALSHVHIDDAQLDLRQQQGTPLNLARAFVDAAAKKPESSASNAPQTAPWAVDIDDATLRNARIDVHMLGVVAHLTRLELDQGVVAVDSSHLSVGGRLRGDLQSQDITVRNVSLALHEAVYHFETSAERLQISQMQVESDGLRLRARGSVQLTPALAWRASADLQADFDALSRAQAAPGGLRVPLQLDALTGGALLHLRGHGDAAGHHVDVDMQGRQLVVASGGATMGIARLQLEGAVQPQDDKQVFTLHTMQIASSAGLLSGDGTLTYDKGLTLHRLQLSSADLAIRRLLPHVNSDSLPDHVALAVVAQGPRLWPIDSRVHIEGSAAGFVLGPGLPTHVDVTGDAHISPRSLQLTRLQARGQGVDIAAYGAVPFSSDGALGVSLVAHAQPNRWLAAQGIALKARALDVRVRAKGSLQRPHLQGDIDVQALQAAVAEDTANVHIPFVFSGGRLRIDAASAQSTWAQVDLSGDAILQQRGVWQTNPMINAQMRIARVNLAAFNPQIGGIAQLDAQAQGPMMAPRGRLAVHVERLKIGQAVCRHASLQATADDAGVRLTSLQVSPQSGGTLEVTGHTEWHNHAVQAEALADDIKLTWLQQAAAMAPSLAGRLHAHGQLQGTWEAPQYNVDARLPIPLQSAIPAATAVRISRALSDVPTHELGLTVHAQGDGHQVRAWVISDAPGAELQAEGAVRFADMRIDARGEGSIEARLASLAFPEVGQLDGQVHVQLQAHGPARQLAPQGHLRIESPLHWRSRQQLGEVQVHSADIDLTPSHIALRNLRGNFNTGSFSGGGVIELASNMQPRGYDMHVHADAIPVRTSDVWLEADVDMNIHSDALWPRLRGKVEIGHGRVTKRMTLHDYQLVATGEETALPLSVTAPWLRNIGLDVMLRTVNAIPTQVDTGVFATRTAVSAELHITGNVLQPRVDGQILATGGMLQFPKAALPLNTAEVSFLPDASGGSTPHLQVSAQGDVTAAASIASATPQVYDVTLDLNGTPDKLAFELQSSPNLDRLAILALLATGHANLTELTEGSGDQSSRLAAALVFAGAQASEPLARFAEAQLERLLNTHVDLAAEITQQRVRVTASKSLNSHLRLEGGYQQGLDASGAAVNARAQLLLTDRVLLEGGAQRDLTQSTAAPPLQQGAQSSLQLKWRVLGE